MTVVSISINDTDFHDILTITSTSAIAQPESFNKSEINDLFCDLAKSKELADSLASRLSEKHTLKPGTNLSFYQHREKEFRQYFHEDGAFVICIDIRLFLSELVIPYYNRDE